ncbi:hypothetical protein BB561_002674 [Smittium simulii]|uniref:Protein BZZ1 n=1 Tax=Smittium simulii TaxID=133385 RepID=A0A2T9YPM0_9FUNG|nr:hypothetical protein BB561_002674 [Smittium simulii]
MISYGSSINHIELPIVNNHISEGIQLLSEIKEFILLRASIEKEYAKKLLDLGKKFDKRISNKGFGQKKSIVRNNSVNSSENHHDEHGNITQQLDSDMDQDNSGIIGILTSQAFSQGSYHLEFSELLNRNYVDDIKKYSIIAEDAKKKISNHAIKLYDKRDKSIAEKDKIKAKYEESVNSHSMAIQKHEKSMDSKAQKYQDKVSEHTDRKNQLKNEYIICTEDYQKLEESRIVTSREKLESFFSRAAELCEQDKMSFQLARDNISKLDPTVAFQNFINSFEEKVYQPTKSFMVVVDQSNGENPNFEKDKNSILILSNRLIKAQTQLHEINENIEQSNLTVYELRLDGNNSINQSFMDSKREVALGELTKAEIQSQISCISSVVGDVDQLAAHIFEPYSFKIPTKCNFCGENIWGTSRKGAKCIKCGFVCHAKCELKVDFSCNQVKENTSGNFLTRAFKSKRSKKSISTELYDEDLPGRSSSVVSAINNSDNTSNVDDPSPNYNKNMSESINPLNINYAGNDNDNKRYSNPMLIPTQSHATKVDVQMPIPIIYTKNIIISGDESKKTINNNVNEMETVQYTMAALYSYSGRNSDELSFNEGETLYILAGDDGSGWALARSINGNTGHVPISYLETKGETLNIYELDKKYMTALYDFEARDVDELSIKAGDRIEFVSMTESSEWVVGKNNNLQGRLPRSYIEFL